LSQLGERTRDTEVMKKIGLLVLWLAGSMAAVGVAWAGVSVVDDQVIDPAPAVDFQASEATTPSPTTTAATTPSPTVGIGASTSTAAPTPDQPATPGQSANPTSTPAATPSPTTSSAPPPQPTAAPTATPAPTSPPAPAATTQTFALTGGTTAISFSPSGVTVLWATPNPGFDVKIEPESSGIKVEFRADNHRSRIDAWWSGGPRHEIREEPE
jgi:hypothetical protein